MSRKHNPVEVNIEADIEENLLQDTLKISRITGTGAISLHMRKKGDLYHSLVCRLPTKIQLGPQDSSYNYEVAKRWYPLSCSSPYDSTIVRRVGPSMISIGRHEYSVS